MTTPNDIASLDIGIAGNPIGWLFYKHDKQEWSLPFKTEIEARSCAGQVGYEPIKTMPIYATTPEYKFGE